MAGRSSQRPPPSRQASPSAIVPSNTLSHRSASNSYAHAAPGRCRTCGASSRLFDSRPASLIGVEGTGEGALGLGFEPRLVATEDDRQCNDHEYAHREGGPAHGPSQAVDVVAEQVAAQAVDRGPEDAAKGVGDQEAVPRHAVRAGQEGGQGTQHCHEAAEEDDLPAVARKEIVPQFELALVQADEIAIAAQQAIAAFPA